MKLSDWKKTAAHRAQCKTWAKAEELEVTCIYFRASIAFRDQEARKARLVVATALKAEREVVHAASKAERKAQHRAQLFAPYYASMLRSTTKTAVSTQIVA